MSVKLSSFIHQRRWLAGLLYMSIGMLSWAIIENIPRFFSRHYTSFEIVWLRYTVHLLFMLLVFAPRQRARLFRTKRLGLQLVRGLLMMGMHLTFIFAIRYLSLDETMAGFWVAPALLLGTAMLLGERFKLGNWAAVLIAYAAVLIMLRAGSALFQPATLLAIGMAACFSLYLAMTRRMLDEDILASLFYTAFSVWVVLGLGLPFYWVTPTLQDLLWLTALGLIGYLGIYGLDKALEASSISVAAPFVFTQPLFAVLANFAMLGTVPGKRTLLGALIIVGCLLYFGWMQSPAMTPYRESSLPPA